MEGRACQVASLFRCVRTLWSLLMTRNRPLALVVSLECPVRYEVGRQPRSVPGGQQLRSGDGTKARAASSGTERGPKNGPNSGPIWRTRPARPAGDLSSRATTTDPARSATLLKILLTTLLGGVACKTLGVACYRAHSFRARAASALPSSQESLYRSRWRSKAALSFKALAGINARTRVGPIGRATVSDGTDSEAGQRVRNGAMRAVFTRDGAQRVPVDDR